MNVYYRPEDLGLTVVAEIEYSDGNYQFDTRVVWKHENGRLYTARDSGCSCPTPFEDYHTLDSLERVNQRELAREVQREVGTSYSSITQAQANDFLRAVREAAKKPTDNSYRDVVGSLSEEAIRADERQKVLDDVMAAVAGLKSS